MKYRNSCFECTRESYNGRKETFYIAAPTLEKARERAIKENPTRYVKVIKEVKFYEDAKESYKELTNNV